MTKYIVSGYIGFDNFGDEAIAMILINKLKSNNAEKITLISSNPEKTTKTHNVNSCSMFNFFRQLSEADTLISGGGSLLQDITSFKSLIYYLGVIYFALFLKKQVIIYAQGIGPINSKVGQILTKFALHHCQKISVRDKKSQELLKQWKINSELVNDPMLDINLPQKHCVGIVGIQLRSYPTLNVSFLKNLAQIIKQYFVDKKIQIISLQDSLDLDICHQFEGMLKKQGLTNIEVINHLSVNKAFEIISNLEYLIGMRFHANVAAIKSGVKTLAINYDPKVEKLAEEYNIPIIQLFQKDFSKEFEQLIGNQPLSF